MKNILIGFLVGISLILMAATITKPKYSVVGITVADHGYNYIYVLRSDGTVFAAPPNNGSELDRVFGKVPLD